jgi:acetyl esterase
VSLNALEGMPVEAARQVNDREAAELFGPVEPVFAVEERDIEGPEGHALRIRVYRPDAEAGRPMLVYFHGGGWTVGSLESHDGVARFLCAKAGCAVISVDYRLAPEHKFPAAVEDAWAATLWAGANADAVGGNAGRLAVGGDSSGGNLAAVVARRARDEEVPLALQLLVYPALDLDLPRASHLAGEYAYWVAQYLHTRADGSDPDASPMRASDLKGVAPALLLSCGLDPLVEQAEVYAQRLQAARVGAKHILYPGLMHGAYRMPGVIPGAGKMLEDSASELAKAFQP